MLVAETPAPLPALAPLLQHVTSHPDGKAPNSIDFAALKGDRSELPIGVFDSGIGGLTVLEAILKLDSFSNKTLQPGADGIPDFAGEKFIYLGDQANMPYGNYPSQGREDYLRELIVKDMVFLLGKRYHGAEGPRLDKPAVKAVVIACNTATAYGIDDMRAALKAWNLDVPVIGVVEAGARAVVEQLPSEGTPPIVGVLATVGTCASNAYPKAIARAAGLAGKPVPRVIQQGSVGLAGAIEGNPAFVWSGAGERPMAYAGPKEAELNSVAAYASFDVKQMVLNPKVSETVAGRKSDDKAQGLGMLVLGCTHFPLIEKELDSALEERRTAQRTDDLGSSAVLVSDKVAFINPAELTAKELFRELAKAKLRAKAATEATASAPAPQGTFYLSVPNPAVAGVKLAADGSLDTAYKVGRKTGESEKEDTKVIPMTMKTLPESSRLLLEKLPAVAERLKVTP
ncbi:aspartate/glutamate racemase family protein [Roseimicrobium sp. ORNL1]|uniref:glutamate racemase n=1 Tax=Roseimicrobium sp. ORNL1 TaxID=2711231 RepID=UPI0019814FB2|nr:aspartate/glutamate racemase family protein [Roseimicrobium sp. ORNL1]